MPNVQLKCNWSRFTIKRVKFRKVCKEAADMDRSVDVMKEQLNITARKKEIHVLTMPAPLSGLDKKLKETFNVFDYSVCQSQRFVKGNGFLVESDPRNRKHLILKLVV